MKKIIIATFLSLTFTSAFADNFNNTSFSTHASGYTQVPEVVQGFKQLLEKDFNGASAIFSEYLQKAFEQRPFIINDDIEAALTGILIALAKQGAEKEIFEAVGRLIVNLVINDSDEEFEEDTYDDEYVCIADHLNVNYGIKKAQLLPLIETIQDSDLKSFVLCTYLE